VGSGDERTAKQRTGSTEQVDGGETELSGDDARRGTGNAVGDVGKATNAPIALPRLAGSTRFRASTPRAGKTSAQPRPVTNATVEALGAQVLNIHT